MRALRIFFFIIVVVLATAGIFLRGKLISPTPLPTPLPFAGTTQTRTIVSKGLTRTFLIHIPTTPGKPKGFILAYHGAGSNGEHMEEYSGLSSFAQENDFLVVYPNSYNGFWADGRGRDADQAGIDDMTFTADVLAFLEKEYELENEETHLVGFSNGAYFVQRLLCQSKTRFASVVSVGASSNKSLLDSCTPIVPTRTLLMIGSYDPAVYGGYLETGTYILPFETAVGQLAKIFGCTQEPEVVREGSVDYRRFTGCTSSSVLESGFVAELDHDWIHTDPPGVFDTTEEVEKFIMGSFKLLQAG